MTTDAAYMRDYREKRRDGFGPIITCACGCGAQFRQYDGHNKRERRFVRGHKARPVVRVCTCGCGRVGQLTRGLSAVCYGRWYRSRT